MLWERHMSKLHVYTHSNTSKASYAYHVSVLQFTRSRGTSKHYQKKIAYIPDMINAFLLPKVVLSPQIRKALQDLLARSVPPPPFSNDPGSFLVRLLICMSFCHRINFLLFSIFLYFLALSFFTVFACF